MYKTRINMAELEKVFMHYNIKSMINGSLFKSILFVLVLTTQVFPTSSADNKPPNIIFILADDLGYSDLGCYGHPDIKSPVLDSLASIGTKFTNFHTAAPLCAPTRVSCMTGRYPWVYGHGSIKPLRNTSMLTVAELFRDAGYATAHIGKWHLGGLFKEHFDHPENAPPGPRDHGFDHVFTMYEDPTHRYVFYTGTRPNVRYSEGAGEYQRNGVPAPSDRWLEDYKYDEAVSLIEKYHSQERPFFMQIWWEVPHIPLQKAPEPYGSMYEGDGNQSHYAGLISWAESGIRRITDKLNQLGIADNTILFFTSDNGPERPANSTGIYRGRKRDLYEGGIRVPAIAVWPGHIRAGLTTDQLSITNDLFPTFASLAGVSIPGTTQLDGIDLSPVLLKNASLPERPGMFWYYTGRTESPRQVIRKGKYKLLATDGIPLEVYNLETDPGETNNILADSGEMAAEMLQELKAWLKNPSDWEGESTE